MESNAASPFATRGVVEGFYGHFYTSTERGDLLRFLGANGFNTYLYAPKGDREGRRNWMRPYPAARMASLAGNNAVAREVGITFIYGLSFNGDTPYWHPDDIGAIVTKLEAMWAIGMRDFALLFDDSIWRPGGRLWFDICTAAQASVANAVRKWQIDHGEHAGRLLVCPWAYTDELAHGNDYLRKLGARLAPDIELLYAGPSVFNSEISAGDMDFATDRLGRRPCLWDNAHCNDLEHRRYAPIGPYMGRAPDLGQAVSGILLNGMTQPHLFRLPLLTAAAYMRNPKEYDAHQAWESAVQRLFGAELAPAFRDFAQALLSVSDHPATWSRPVGILQTSFMDMFKEFDALDAACYRLETGLESSVPRTEIMPWIEATMAWIRVAGHVLLLLDAQPIPERARKAFQEALADAYQYNVGASTIERRVVPWAKLVLARIQETARTDLGGPATMVSYRPKGSGGRGSR